MKNTDLWTTLGARRLDLTGGGSFFSGRRTEFLLVGALIVVIGGSLALTLFSAWGTPGTGKFEPPWYKCNKCGHEFQVEMTEGGPGAMPGGPGDPTMMYKAPDCPSCKAEGTGELMVACPKCEKRYVSEINRHSMQFRGGIPPAPQDPAKMPKDICPFCQTDRMEWFKAQRKSKKKK